MDDLGNYKLGSLPVLSAAQIALIAISLLDQLEIVHEAGLVYGSMQLSGVAFKDPSAPWKSLRLNDFTRSQPYVSPEGYFVNQGTRFLLEMPASEKLVASPWELEGFMTARRDDMFRLGEVLLRLSGVMGKDPFDFRYSSLFLVEDKNSLATYSGAPPVVSDFIKYTLKMKFTDKPKYEEWRARFKASN